MFVSVGAETVPVIASFFGSDRGGGEGWVMCLFSFSSCKSLETGLGSEAALGALPSTWTSTGADLTDPESSRSNICLGLVPGSSYPLRIEGLGIL